MNRQDFLDSVNSEHLKKTLNWCLSNIETKCQLDEIPKMAKDDIIDLILSVSPTSYMMAESYLYTVKAYVSYIGDEKASQTLSKIKVGDIWNENTKPKDTKKFLSEQDFKELINEIEMKEDFNVDFYTAILQCIYEGIYIEDLSVLKNLRGSDIHGNIVTLREDNGSVYDLEISQQLADKLLKLSNTHIWNRRNRNSDGYEITIYGEYHDSCFKIEQRKEKGSAEQEVQRYRKVYLAWISKITSKYIGNSVRPLYIYVSGIMCRIKHIFEDDNTGFDLRFAFVENPRFRMTGILIEKELERCHYNKPRYQLNKMVNGYIDVFE